MMVRFLSVAESEISAAVKHYESQSPNLGRRFMSEVGRTLEAIMAFPQAGTLLVKDIRRRLVRDFPFAILYSVLPGEILIVAVMDLRRDPDYWKSRM